MVCDTPELVVLFQPEGTVIERFDFEDGSAITPLTVRMNILHLMFPGLSHAVLLYFDAGTGVPPWFEKHFSWPDGEFKGWKIDLESPFKRTPLGFDITDNMLDVIVRPDFSWYWKDEEGLARRVRQGLYTAQEAESFYADGRQAIQAVEKREPPFSDPWPEWRPDASWSIPHAPADWEKLPGVNIDLNRNAPYRSLRRGVGLENKGGISGRSQA
jgi:hypothetical protein